MVGGVGFSVEASRVAVHSSRLWMRPILTAISVYRSSIMLQVPVEPVKFRHWLHVRVCRRRAIDLRSYTSTKFFSAVMHLAIAQLSNPHA